MQVRLRSKKTGVFYYLHLVRRKVEQQLGDGIVEELLKLEPGKDDAVLKGEWPARDQALLDALQRLNLQQQHAIDPATHTKQNKTKKERKGKGPEKWRRHR